jgi:membrane-associated protein
LERAQKFYEKYGGKTIILARFTPIVRTFAPIVAGAGKMKYKTFFFFNIIGGFLWGVGITFAGYFLGRSIPNVDKYLLPIVLLIIVVSLLPTIIHFTKGYFSRKLS